VGSIVGAVIFGLIALGLLVCLLMRLRRQRAAQQAYYNQQVQLAPLAVLRVCCASAPASSLRS
jgi:hypothetical protein